MVRSVRNKVCRSQRVKEGGLANEKHLRNRLSLPFFSLFSISCKRVSCKRSINSSKLQLFCYSARQTPPHKKTRHCCTSTNTTTVQRNASSVTQSAYSGARYANIPVAEARPNIRVFPRIARRYANPRGREEEASKRVAPRDHRRVRSDAESDENRSERAKERERNGKKSGRKRRERERERETVPRGVSGRWEMGKGDRRNEAVGRVGISASRSIHTLGPFEFKWPLSNNVTYVPHAPTGRCSLNT